MGARNAECGEIGILRGASRLQNAGPWGAQLGWGRSSAERAIVGAGQGSRSTQPPPNYLFASNSPRDGYEEAAR